MKTTLIKTKDIVTQFALATQNKDFKILKSLLLEDGEFEIENEIDFSDKITVNKKKFLKWYKTKIENATITNISYDECLSCFIGNPVVLFNHGEFPRKTVDYSERSKTGLMLNVKGDKIMDIQFCFVFLKTENKYLYQCIGDRVKKLIDRGFPLDDAIQAVAGGPGS